MKNIDFELQAKLRKYLEYLNKEEDTENQEKEKEIIKKLPSYLKKEFLIKSNKKTLETCPFLTDNFSERVLIDTLHIM